MCSAVTPVLYGARADLYSNFNIHGLHLERFSQTLGHDLSSAYISTGAVKDRLEATGSGHPLDNSYGQISNRRMSCILQVLGHS